MKRERRGIFVFLALLSSSALSFDVGLMTGASRSSQPLIIEKPVYQSSGVVQGTSEQGVVLGEETKREGSQNSETCAFVGSRNSTLYHLPSCASAKRIKSENRVCFSSREDAEKRGYEQGCVK